MPLDSDRGPEPVEGGEDRGGGEYIPLPSVPSHQGRERIMKLDFSVLIQHYFIQSTTAANAAPTFST